MASHPALGRLVAKQVVAKQVVAKQQDSRIVVRVAPVLVAVCPLAGLPLGPAVDRESMR
jgi:hypothetical protein